MGDFSISCAMSGMSLMYKPVAFFPLVRRKYWDEAMSGMHIVTNEGPESLFTVATLPIFGTLDCYGNIDDIEENANTKAIERFTGKTIAEFVDDVRQGQFCMDIGELFQAEPKDEVAFSACVVHRQMYDKFSTTELNERGKSEYSVLDGGYGDLNRYSVELLGFKVIKLEKEKDNDWDRPKAVMTHPDIPDFVIKADGMYTHCYFKGEKIEWVYHLNQVIATIKKLTKYKFSDEVLATLRSTPANIPTLKDSREQMRLFVKREEKRAAEWKKMGMKDYYEGKDIVERAAYDGNHFFHWILSHGMVSKYWPEIDAETLDNEFAALGTFKTGMLGANRLFMPTWNGYQYGNHYAQRAVHREAIKILNEKIKHDRSRR